MPIYTDGLGLSATELGQNDAAATADALTDVTTTPAQGKLRLILNRLASNAFTATIQGAARTELDVMLNTIATYFSASGAAYSSVVDPGGATRTEIETVLEDIAKMLAGGGITTYPVAAVPGDNANFAAVIRKIYDLVALIPTTAMRGTDNAMLAADGATATELAKVPKSDAAVTWNATALASVNAEVDTALNTIVPASPTAGSLNDALSKAAGGNTFDKTTDSLEALSDKVALDTTVAKAAAASEGRLAELDAANIPADVDGLKTSRDRQLFSMDFWSAPQEEVAIPAVAATLTLPTVTITDLPSGATVTHAVAMVKFRAIENINAGANKLNGATVAGTSQVIQVRDDTPGTWRDAIKFVDDQFGLAASTREGGDVLIGDTDIAVEVDANDGYNFQYLLASADLLGINWNDVQVGLRVWFSV